MTFLVKQNGSTVNLYVSVMTGKDLTRIPHDKPKYSYSGMRRRYLSVSGAPIEA